MEHDGKNYLGSMIVPPKNKVSVRVIFISYTRARDLEVSQASQAMA